MRNLWVGGAWLLGLFLFSASAHAGEPALLRGMALSEPTGQHPCPPSQATPSKSSFPHAQEHKDHLWLVTHCGQSLPTPSLAASPVSSTQVTLTWTVGSATGVDHYEVWRSAGTVPISVGSAGSSALSYTDNGTAANTIYSYRVRAVDAQGNLGLYSNIATATTPTDAAAPNAPTGLTATVAASTQINLNWTAPADNVGVTGYRVERCTGAGCGTFAQIATPTTTFFIDTGLTSGTSYNYRVRAVDAATNPSGYSSTVSATTLALAPTGLTASDTPSDLGNSITLTWTPSASSGVVEQRVYRSTTSSGPYTLVTQLSGNTATSFVNATGLTNGTTYFYVVRAFNGADSANSNESSAVPTDNFGCIKTWNGSSSAVWSTAANWTPSVVPVASEVVCIPNGLTVTASTAVSIKGLYSDGSVTISNSFTIGTGATQIPSRVKNFTMNSGATLTGTANLTVAAGGVFTWSAGTMSGASTMIIPSGATMTISGTTGKTLSARTLNNAGIITWTGTGALQINSNAAINNQSGGIFDAQGDAMLTSTVTPSAFNNQAGSLFKKSVGTGTTTIGGLTFSNSGTVSAQSGILSIGGSTITFTGTLTATAPGTLRFNSSGTQTLDTASTVSGNGTIQFNTGTVNVGGTYNVTGITTVSGGTANFNTGVTVASVGAVTVTAGTANFNFGGTLAITILTQSAGTIAGTTSLNLTTYNWSGGTMSGTGTSTIVSGGILTASGAGTKTLSRSLTNSGTVQVTGGTLSLTGGGTHSGAFTAATGATLTFGGGTHTVSAGSTISGAGTVTFSAGTVNIAGTYNVTGTTTMAAAANFNSVVTNVGNTLNVNSGATANFNFAGTVTLPTLNHSAGTVTGTANLSLTTYNWSGGAMRGTGSGTTTVGGNLALSGTATKTLQRTLYNAGTATWVGTGTFTFESGGALKNQVGGTFDIQNDSSFVLSGSGSRTVTNAGTFKKSAGTGSTTIPATFPFTNTGTVEATSGTLTINAYTQTAGTTKLNGGVLSTTGILSINGGTLTGFGAITGNVSNAGQVTVGLSPGTLTITGTYTQTTTGVLNIELGGLTVGTQYDRLAITGSATLAGTLNVTLINGFTPSVGDSFTIMTQASRTGDFTTKNLPNLGSNVMQTIPGTTTYLLTVSGP